ncbi:MAG: helix-turn-helix transcriptional regulator [Ferruginibacter sp.]
MLKRLLKGKNFIEDTYLKNPCIAEIVKECNMTPFNFFREFKLAFGVSPYQYIMKKRMEYAQHLVMKDLSFTSVATTCGFPDLFTFSKAFKKSFGASPAKYKNQLVKNLRRSLFKISGYKE